MDKMLYPGVVGVVHRQRVIRHVTPALPPFEAEKEESRMARFIRSSFQVVNLDPEPVACFWWFPFAMT
jgi:hypothetical protein